MNEEQELPEGWVRTELGIIGVWVGGGTPSKAKEQFWTDGTISWVSPKDMKTLRITDTEDHLSVNALEETVLKLCPVGTVLIVVRSGILERTLPVAIAQTPVTMNQDMKGIYPENGIEPMYTAYYLICSDRDIRSRCSKNGTTVSSIETGMLKSYPIFLPPLREQQRIVSAIEERFTILDAVATALQQNKQKLKLARASVLKHAVEGKLTEKWRAEHPASESGSELLERILVERRTKWEAEQLAKGKDLRKLRYEEPAGPDVSELLDLPEEWCLVTMNQVVARSEYGISTKCDYEAMGVPVLRIPNIAAGEIDLSDMKYSVQSLDLTEDSALQVGDILVCRTNGSIGLIGKAAQVRRNLEPYHTFASYLLRFRLCETTVLPTWLHLFIGSYQGRFFIESHAASSAGQHNISLTLMHGMPFPLPPLAEQQQIVTEVERCLSIIEQAQVAIETSLKRIERARQSILEMAFLGRLVPQDPHDEPASVLLERIQEERGKRLAQGKLRGKNGGVKAARGRKTREEDFVPQWQLLKDAKQSGLIDGSLSSVSAHGDGASERREVGQGEMDKEELGGLVQMPLFSLWD